MKKKLVATLATSSLLLLACSNEENNEANEEQTTHETEQETNQGKQEVSEAEELGYEGYEEDLDAMTDDEYTEDGFQYGEFGETYSLQAADYTFLEANLYENGVGGYDEPMFELVYEVTNNTDELATPVFLSQWDYTVVIEEEDYVEAVEERLPYFEEGEVDEEVAKRHESVDIKPGGTVTHSIWYEYHDEPMYILVEEAGVVIPIEF